MLTDEASRLERTAGMDAMRSGKWRPKRDRRAERTLAESVGGVQNWMKLQKRTPSPEFSGVQNFRSDGNGRHMMTVDPPIILTRRPDLNAGIFRLMKIFFYKNTVYLVQ